MNTKNIKLIIGLALTLTAFYFIYTMIDKKIFQDKIKSLNQTKKTTDTIDATQVKTSGGAINNVGNIRHSKTKYQGEIESPSTEFKSFSSLAYGYRAMIQILRAYYKQGYTNLREVINHYAPPKENNTNAYTEFVSDSTGIPFTEDLYQTINSPMVMGVIASMSTFEQGHSFTLNPTVIRAGYDLAPLMG